MLFTSNPPFIWGFYAGFGAVIATILDLATIPWSSRWPAIELMAPMLLIITRSAPTNERNMMEMCRCRVARVALPAAPRLSVDQPGDRD